MLMNEQEAIMKQNILLTPGPLTTSKTVKESMLFDLGTRDEEYQQIVQEIQKNLLDIAHSTPHHTCILLQGSGTYGVESVLTSTIGEHEKVLILANGAYGDRMATICAKANLAYVKVDYPMTNALPLERIEEHICREDITHVAYIHCETTAGVLNDVASIQRLIHKHNKISIVDAMSSFGGIPISIKEQDIDYVITSSNKCLHGVPGIAIVFANTKHLDHCKGICKSLSLDLYDQYTYMKRTPGSFRFTSPTHVILALHKAIQELHLQGGVEARHQRYVHTQHEIYQAMKEKGFKTLVDCEEQAPIITTYQIPNGFDFHAFYDYFKSNGFLLYSGKLPGIEAFRIGNIGHIQEEDITRFISILNNYKELPHED